MASSSASGQRIKVEDRLYLSEEELLYYRPNTHITVLPANHHKNLLSKDYLVLTSDKNHNFDQTVVPVALFGDKWHYINWS